MQIERHQVALELQGSWAVIFNYTIEASKCIYLHDSDSYNVRTIVAAIRALAETKKIFVDRLYICMCVYPGDCRPDRNGLVHKNNKPGT